MTRFLTGKHESRKFMNEGRDGEVFDGINGMTE
jgi:hypothetical protein